MIPANLQPLANHLWQSTLSVALVALLTLALRKNRAAVRYWLWLAASVKFLIPFSLLVDAGRRLEWRSHSAISQPQFSYALDQIARPFAMLAPAPPQTAAPSAPVEFSTILLGVWLCGAAIGAFCWFRSWRRIHAAKRSASPLYLKLPIPAFSTPSQMEPGVFGIRKPVLLLPEGILDRLTPAQLEAVFAHELCHVRRRDNLTAALHTVVETIFWFHPLVWWIRARLVEEREHACDEVVLGKVSDAQDYAEGILNVCKLYLESPLKCVSGVMGSNLKKRVHSIIYARTPLELNFRRKILLGVASFAVVAGPIAIGIAGARQTGTDSSLPRFDVASIRPSNPSIPSIRRQVGHGTFTTAATTMLLLMEAFGVKNTEVKGGPGWIETDYYDIRARGDSDATSAQMKLMLQALLADRFHLVWHWESKNAAGYILTVADKNCRQPTGLKPSNVSEQRAPIEVRQQGIQGHGASMSDLAGVLSIVLRLPVLDQTGLTGTYDFRLVYDDPRLTVQQGDEVAGLGSIFTAFRDAGLRLTKGTVPVRTLHIDQITRPTEN